MLAERKIIAYGPGNVPVGGTARLLAGKKPGKVMQQAWEREKKYRKHRKAVLAGVLIYKAIKNRRT